MSPVCTRRKNLGREPRPYGENEIRRLWPQNDTIPARRCDGHAEPRAPSSGARGWSLTARRYRIPSTHNPSRQMSNSGSVQSVSSSQSSSRTQLPLRQRSAPAQSSSPSHGKTQMLETQVSPPSQGSVSLQATGTAGRSTQVLFTQISVPGHWPVPVHSSATPFCLQRRRQRRRAFPFFRLRHRRHDLLASASSTAMPPMPIAARTAAKPPTPNRCSIDRRDDSSPANDATSWSNRFDSTRCLLAPPGESAHLSAA